MKKYLATVVSVSALVATSAVAFAADLPTRKEAAIAPVPQLWTGAYAGLNVGGGFSTSNTVQTIGYSTFDWAASTLGMPFGFSAPYRSGYASVGQSGVIGGGQVGYNYQINPNILIGFEADFQGSGISGSGTSYGLGGAIDASDKTHLQNGLVSTTAGIGWMGTARARVGYLVKPTLLLFGTGGFAYGDTWANVNSIGLHSHPRGEAPDLVMPTSGSFNNVSVGWTAGGGAEWMFIQNWSSKVEVLYYDLGSQTLNGQYSPLINPASPYNSVAIINGASTKVNYQGVIARLGVNYHFNLANIAPVVAKF